MRSGKLCWVVVLLLVLLGLGWTSTTASAQEIKLKWSTFYPVAHPLGPMYQKWGDEISKRTNGKVKISYFFAGTLLKGNELYEGVVKGASDMGESVVGYTRGRFPAMESICLPMGYPDAMNATAIANEFYKKFKPKEFEDTKVLLLHAHGPGILHSKKPVHKLEDVQGLKIRSDSYSAKVAKALGGVPVAMTMAETYESLQKGVVEATLSPLEAMQTWKQAEVVKYTTDSRVVGYTSVFYCVMNMKKWNSLPKDVQKVFEEVSAEYIPKFGALWDYTEEEARKYVLARGNTIISLPNDEAAKWVKAVEPVMDEYVKDAESKGLPGKEYVKFVQEGVAKYSKK